LVLSELWRMLCQWCDQSVLAFGNLASKWAFEDCKNAEG
jgi:hypothetical protein